MIPGIVNATSNIGRRLTSGFKNAGYIGFDLGMEKLNLVQVDFSLTKPVISNASSEYHNSDYEELLSDPRKLQALVKSVLKKKTFKGREVVASVPANLLKLLFINYTCKTHEDETRALINALENRTKESLADYVIDYLPVNPHAAEQINRMALVAMAKQDDVEAYLDILDSCGLRVAALEVGPVAIKRLISAIRKDQDSKKVLVINFGSKKSYLTVLWDQELLLDREMEFGMDDILNAIARSFEIKPKTALEVLHKYGVSNQYKALEAESQVLSDVSEEDDESIRQVLIDIVKPSLMTLANEIRDILVYVASETRGGAVEQIYLLGSLARVEDIDQLIDHLISIPVKTINPFYGLDQNKTDLTEDIGPVSGIAVATGLALRGKG